MPKAKITKSGKWRCRVVERYEYVDGKRKIIFKSVTGDTKKEAELLASMFLSDRESMRAANITVKNAIDRYISSKDKVLSPSTLASYKSFQRVAYADIGHIKVRDITTEDIQRWMNVYQVGRSPKTCRNANALLLAAIGMFRPGVHFRVLLPAKRPPDLYTPTDADVRLLLKETKGTDLELAILLSAFGTLRRGEVCALTYDDIQGDTVSVTKSLVKKDGKWIVKVPKTPQSFRTVSLPKEVIRRIKRGAVPGERIVKITPSTVTQSFWMLTRSLGYPNFRFHDLRAYAVSVRHALGVPDQYIMADGGYKSDVVMKQVYRRTMDDRKKVYKKKVNGHFASILKASGG